MKFDQRKFQLNETGNIQITIQNITVEDDGEFMCELISVNLTGFSKVHDETYKLQANRMFKLFYYI